MAMDDASAAETTAEARDARTTDRMSVRSPRVEVIMRGERRRRSVEQKREIAAESLEPGISPITGTTVWHQRRVALHVALTSAGGNA
jgi:hypothetical protein